MFIAALEGGVDEGIRGRGLGGRASLLRILEPGP
jgi:hypothetical protein